jgi:hypothetical protein
VCIGYGTPDFLIRSSCAALARRYPLSGRVPVPTTDSATWCFTPAASSAVRMSVVEVTKKLITSSSANDGELDTSTTTSAPASASSSPSPVRVLTPVCGAAGTASCPWAVSSLMTLEPIRPVPPMTTIFMTCLPGLRWARSSRLCPG